MVWLSGEEAAEAHMAKLRDGMGLHMAGKLLMLVLRPPLLEQLGNETKILHGFQ